MHASMTMPQYKRQEVSIDGHAVHLTPNETELVALLLTNSPHRPVDKVTIIEAIWPNPDLQPETADKIIDVLIMRVRKKAVPIKTEWGRGFSIPEHFRLAA